MKRFALILMLVAMGTLFGVKQAPAAEIIQSWVASDIKGRLAPPDYALRLDGYFNNRSSKEVTFTFDSVCFDEYDDGTARLHGMISVAEYNNRGGPRRYASSWNLDVQFTSTTGSNSSWRYYTLVDDPAHELVNKADGNDFADLFHYGGPFQVGTGANGKNNNMGAAGWLNWVHNDNGYITGSETRHFCHSDFLMDLTPKNQPPVIPEPATLGLIGIGLVSLAAARRRTRRRRHS